MLNYHGAEQPAPPLLDKRYPGIETPAQLYLALKRAWSLDTCSPSLQSSWSPANPSLGQCSITALIFQDLFGGEVYGMHLPGGAVHCYNVVEGRRYDLTSEQFGHQAQALSYGDDPVVVREQQFWDPEKRRRYDRLSSALSAASALSPAAGQP